MFTTTFFIMLGLGIMLALTAALASHAGLIAPGLAYDSTETPDAIALIKYGAISPASVFKLVITLAVIGIAVTLIFMFTTIALVLFGLAGIAAAFAYMRNQPARK